MKRSTCVALTGTALVFALIPAQSKPLPQPQSAAAVSVRPQDAAQVLFLVRNTLIAVHQANVTGNYTVLRDLSAPDFRDRNTAADLARIFAKLRAQRVDLSAAAVLDPRISAARVTPQQQLQIAGSVATQPVPVRFELLFRPVAGAWRIEGISIAPAQ